jgi:hypothetical protein
MYLIALDATFQHVTETRDNIPSNKTKDIINKIGIFPPNYD